MKTPNAALNSGVRRAPGWLKPTVIMLSLFFATFLAIALADRSVPESHAFGTSVAQKQVDSSTINASFSAVGDLPAFDPRSIPEVAESMTPESMPSQCRSEEGKVIECEFH
jgi:hypothetical protein